MEISERLSELDRNIKKDIETVASSIWCGELMNDSIRNIRQPWSFYEIASKTQFQQSDSILTALQNIDGCETCKACCSELIRSKEHMPSEIFASDECCLLDWKQDMRKDHHSYEEVTERQLDFTMSILKPGHDSNTRSSLLLASDAIIVAEKTVKLTPDDVAFLYTSAYGKDFIEDLIEYMTSDEVEILLLNSPDIGSRQNDIKHQVRSSLRSDSPMNNNLHLPDSFHESLAQLTYFFPEESNLYARV